MNYALVLSLAFGQPLGNVSNPKICSKIGEAIEDSLMKAVRAPMKQLHSANTLLPTHPIRIIDNGDKIEKDFAKNQLRLVAGTDQHIDA
jgi:hypothetical protein